MRLLIAIVVLSVLAEPVLHSESKSQLPTHGTINILLANSHGIVLVTDSRASDQFGRKVNDTSQKLFQIDPVTVCSIAGFGSDRGPYWKLRTSAGGVISAFAEGLEQSHGNPSFRQKVVALTQQLSFRLEVLESEYQYAEHSRPPAEDKLIMLFAGFDVDGSTVIARAEVSVSAIRLADSTLSYQGNVSDIKIEPINKDFLYLISGVDDSAKFRLKSPQTFGDEKELKDYGQAVRHGHTADLSLDQMDKLANYLGIEASLSSSVIGGPIQEATLTDQHVKMKLPNNLTLDTKPLTSVFLIDDRIQGFPVFPAISTPPNSVFVDVDCENSAMILDDSIIIGGRYVKCNFYFDGGDVYRDPSVKIDGGQLILGPHEQLLLRQST